MATHTLNENTDSDSTRPKRLELSSPSSNITNSQIEIEFSHHDPAFARINNGSFGCCPLSIISAQRQWQLQFLRQPDNFYFNHLQPGILHSRSIVKSLINADHINEVSLLDNVTTAVAIVFQKLAWSFCEGRFNKGDVVVMLHNTYGAVKKSFQAYVKRAGGHVIEAQFPFPVKSKEEIVTEFRKALEKGRENGKKVRLAVIDHVTSMPSAVIPIKELVKLCREEGVGQVFVDAAHGIGCVDVDMKEIGADFYTSNLSKWFFCPPAVAFLYCRKASEGDDDLHHPLVSHEYGNGLPAESAWIGTRDYSAQLVIPLVLEFINRFPGGIEGIKKSNHDSAVEMGEMLVKAWGTHLGCPPEMSSSMIMVGLPISLGILSQSDASKFWTNLRDNFGVSAPIYFRAPKDGESDPITGYAQISYQVYNKIEDYYKFRDAVNKLVNDGFTCACLPD